MEATFKYVGVCDEDFKQIFDREPTEEEFKEFAYLCEKALLSQIDWSWIFEAAKEEMKGGKN